jgi:hypothetical protein
VGDVMGHERIPAVLAAAEALLFRGGHDLTIDDQGRGRIMEDGVDAEDAHRSGT